MKLVRLGLVFVPVVVIAPFASAQRWTHVEDQKLTGSDTAAGDRFGSDVALDGDTLLVGAPFAGPNQRGAAYVFVRTNGAWSQQAKLTATIGPVLDSDQFGTSVALDGDLAVVGAPKAGATDRGAVYVFRRTGTTWTAEAPLVWTFPQNHENFGASVAIADSTVAVGVPHHSWSWDKEGSVAIFTEQGGAWSISAHLLKTFSDEDDAFGRGVDLEPLGAGQYWLAGTSYWSDTVLFSGSGANWTEDEYLEEFWDGRDVALSNGSLAVSHVHIGFGSVTAYTPTGPVWSSQSFSTPTYSPNSHYGWGLDLDGDLLAIGEPNSDLIGADEGSVFVYARNGTVWSLVRTINASDSEPGDDFGESLALSGEDLMVGNPTDTNAAGTSAGSVYVLRIGSPSVSYCTAGVSSSGCVARMSTSGIPSASLSSPFTLDTSNVPGQRAGIVFYGVGGAEVEPWNGSSFLCVKQPVQRTLQQVSNGTAGACDGAFVLHWNAYVASHPTSLGQPFAAGQQICTQSWYRDPLAVKSTQLSDALAFVLQP